MLLGTITNLQDTQEQSNTDVLVIFSSFTHEQSNNDVLVIF